MLNITADQRYKLGEEVFLNTHYPVSFRRFQGNNKDYWEEEKLLSLLGENGTYPGEKVFVLFGAAGAGKSETMRFLETQLRRFTKKPVLHISRLELDPVYIMEKVLKSYDDGGTEEIIINWGQIKKKPIAFANTIVWNALSSLFDNDDDIIPLGYKLRPIIENNISKNFWGKNYEVNKVEILSQEEFEDLFENSAIPMKTSYEKLRKAILRCLENEIFRGYNFRETLHKTGEYLKKKTKERPILLIDDLVQSLNIYASDLLDYFISLEDNSWDIVIGLTPAAFENTKRGRNLLNRINSLDTFDDRFYKLWLTDEVGFESFNINEKNASDYLKNYIREFKKINGYECNRGCKLYKTCISMQWGKEEDLELTPLNRYLIKRILRKIPVEKGIPRQLVLKSKTYFESILEGNADDFIKNEVERDFWVSGISEFLRPFLESMLPEDSSGQIEVNPNFFRGFGKNYKKPKKIRITTLADKNVSFGENGDEKIERKEETDDTLVAVRNWLEGKKENKELLKKFRSSWAKILKEFGFLPFVERFSSRVYGVVKWRKNVEGNWVPISLEGVDNFKGITISRNLFEKNFLPQLIENETKKDYQEEYLNDLLKDYRTLSYLEEFNAFVDVLQERLDQLIGLPLYEISFLLYTFIHSLSPYNYIPNFLKLSSFEIFDLGNLLDEWIVIEGIIKESDKDKVEELFEDCFLLRDGVYNVQKLELMVSEYGNSFEVAKRVASLDFKIPKEYKIGEETLDCFFSKLRGIAIRVHSLVNGEDYKKYCSDIYSIGVDLKKLNENRKQLNSLVKNLKNNKELDKLIINIDCAPKNDLKWVEEDLSYHQKITIAKKISKSNIFLWYNKMKTIENRLKKEVDQKNFILQEEFQLAASEKERIIPEKKGNKAIQCLSNIWNYCELLRKYDEMEKKLTYLKPCLSKSFQKKVEDFIGFYTHIGNFLGKEQKKNYFLERNSRKCQSLLIHLKNQNKEIEKIYNLYFDLDITEIEKTKEELLGWLIKRIEFETFINDFIGNPPIWGDKRLLKNLKSAKKHFCGNQYKKIRNQLERREEKAVKRTEWENFLSKKGIKADQVLTINNILYDKEVEKSLKDLKFRELELIQEKVPELAERIKLLIYWD